MQGSGNVGRLPSVLFERRVVSVVLLPAEVVQTFVMTRFCGKSVDVVIVDPIDIGTSRKQLDSILSLRCMVKKDIGVIGQNDPIWLRLV